MDWKALAAVLQVPLNADDPMRVIAPLESMQKAFEPLRAGVQLDTPMWTPPERAE